MKKSLLLFIFSITIGPFCFAQQVKIKKGKVLVDNTEYANIEKNAAEMSIFGLNNNKELIFIDLIIIKSPTKETEDKYLLVKFLDFGTSIEFRRTTRKQVIKKLFNSNVIVDSNINEENMKKFIEKYDEKRGETRIRVY